MKRTGFSAALALLLTACSDAPARDAAIQPDIQADTAIELDPAALRAAADSAAARDSTIIQSERADLTAADQGWTTSPSAVNLSGGSVAYLEDVRAEAHEGFDRLVFDFGQRSMPNYEVQFVTWPQYQCGSGEEVRLRGAAGLSIKLQPSQAHDDAGHATIADRSRNLSLPAVLELRLVCDFEGQVEWLAGLESQTGYRVMMLQRPTRLMVDIRH